MVTTDQKQLQALYESIGNTSEVYDQTQFSTDLFPHFVSLLKEYDFAAALADIGRRAHSSYIPLNELIKKIGKEVVAEAFVASKHGLTYLAHELARDTAMVVYDYCDEDEDIKLQNASKEVREKLVFDHAQDALASVGRDAFEELLLSDDWWAQTEPPHKNFTDYAMSWYLKKRVGYKDMEDESKTLFDLFN